MKTWVVVEELKYLVEAESEEQACQMIIKNANRDGWLWSVEDWYAYLHIEEEL